MRRVPAIALLVVTVLSAAAFARQQGNRIRGKVRASSGAAIPNAVITLQTGNGQPINQTVSNNEGDFAFSGLTETGYIVIASSSGYENGTSVVEFTKGAGAEDPGEIRVIEVILTRPGAEPVPPARSTFTQNIPKEALAAFERGMALSREGKAPESIQALQEAVKIFPNYFNARLALANEFTRQQRLEEAISELEQARRVNPKDGRVYQAFGLVLSKQKKYVLAAAVFGEASRLNPTDPNILLMRAGALIDHASLIDPSKSKDAAAERAHAFEMAERDLMKAFDLSGKKLAPIHLQMARIYEKQGKRAQAADELERYLRLAPGEKNAQAMRDAIKKLRTP
ncbi:MAG TPA: tetratricopeptide repeat protein [Blastocatellia bacterium]|jgi:tetratricopeptide (TPR) repeat protein|nr:tetratricopeptide repeat protein [Blastocatellia bacterium]